jgi:hypothetical protein
MPWFGFAADLVFAFVACLLTDRTDTSLFLLFLLPVIVAAESLSHKGLLAAGTFTIGALLLCVTVAERGFPTGRVLMSDVLARGVLLVVVGAVLAVRRRNETLLASTFGALADLQTGPLLQVTWPERRIVAVRGANGAEWRRCLCNEVVGCADCLEGASPGCAEVAEPPRMVVLQRRCFEVRALPMPDAHGQPAAALVLLSDVTDRERLRWREEAANMVNEWADLSVSPLQRLAQAMRRDASSPADDWRFDRVRAWAYHAERPGLELEYAEGMDDVACVGDRLGREDPFNEWLTQEDSRGFRIYITAETEPRETQPHYNKAPSPNWADFQLRTAGEHGRLLGKVSVDNQRRGKTAPITDAQAMRAMELVNAAEPALAAWHRLESTRQALSGVAGLLRLANGDPQPSEQVATALLLTALTSHRGCCFDRAVCYLVRRDRGEDHLELANAVGSTEAARYDWIAATVGSWQEEELVAAVVGREGLPDTDLFDMLSQTCPRLAFTGDLREQVERQDHGPDGWWWRSGDAGPLSELGHALGNRDMLVIPMRSSQGIKGLLVAQSPFTDYQGSLPPYVQSVMGLFGGQFCAAARLGNALKWVALTGLHCIVHLLERAWEAPGDAHTMLPALVQQLEFDSTALSHLMRWAMDDVYVGSKSVDLGTAVDKACRSALATTPPETPAPRNGVPSGLTVLADREVLEVVLRNIIDNALRHTTSAEPISLDHRTEVRDGQHWLCLDVRNAGSGFRDDALHGFAHGRVPSLQGLRSGAEPALGRSGGSLSLGFGLGVSRCLIEAMGGTMEIGNDEDGRARQSVRLPAAQRTDLADV